MCCQHGMFLGVMWVCNGHGLAILSWLFSLKWSAAACGLVSLAGPLRETGYHEGGLLVLMQHDMYNLPEYRFRFGQLCHNDYRRSES